MAINKQVVIKLDILQTKLDSVIQSVENLDFDLADGLDQSNIATFRNARIEFLNCGKRCERYEF